MNTIDARPTSYEEGSEESIKIERNSRGYNWSFRLKREEGEAFASWVRRCIDLDTMLRYKFGGV